MFFWFWKKMAKVSDWNLIQANQKYSEPFRIIPNQSESFDVNRVMETGCNSNRINSNNFELRLIWFNSNSYGMSRIGFQSIYFERGLKCFFWIVSEWTWRKFQIWIHSDKINATSRHCEICFRTNFKNGLYLVRC